MRRFGMGDVLSICGLGIYFVFTLISLICYATDARTFGWPGVNLIILLLLTGGPVAAMVLSFRRTEVIALNYLFAAFVTLVVLWNVGGVRGFRVGRDFYMLLGALLVGFGAYFIKHGPSALFCRGGFVSGEGSEPAGAESGASAEREKEQQ